MNVNEYLSKVYYEPKRSGGFGEVERLHADVKKDGKFDIKEWC